jgi:hypothetical protein
MGHMKISDFLLGLCIIFSLQVSAQSNYDVLSAASWMMNDTSNFEIKVRYFEREGNRDSSFIIEYGQVGSQFRYIDYGHSLIVLDTSLLLVIDHRQKTISANVPRPIYFNRLPVFDSVNYDYSGKKINHLKTEGVLKSYKILPDDKSVNRHTEFLKIFIDSSSNQIQKVVAVSENELDSSRLKRGFVLISTMTIPPLQTSAFETSRFVRKPLLGTASYTLRSSYSSYDLILNF